MKKRYKSYKLDNRHIELEIEELRDIVAQKLKIKSQRDEGNRELAALRQHLEALTEDITELDARISEQESRIIYLMIQQNKSEVIVDRVKYFLSPDKTALERELILPPRS